jgi:hypothetical protein
MRFPKGDHIEELICPQCLTKFRAPISAHRTWCSISCSTKARTFCVDYLIKYCNDHKDDSDDACWIWPFALRGNPKNPDKYGSIYYEKRLRYVHNVAFEIFVRPLRAKEFALHRCDNPPCFRVFGPTPHIFAGTHKDNMQDASAKGRLKDQWGEKNRSCKIPDALVHTIKADYAAGGVTMRELAIRYSISQPHICNIVNGKRRAQEPPKSVVIPTQVRLFD